MGLVVEAALAAEAATEMRHDNAHAVRREFQRFTHPGPSVERNLG